MSNTESILATRQDILLEGYQNMDGSGNYASPRVESAGINNLRVATNYSSVNDSTAMVSVQISEASFDDTADDSNRVTVRNQSIPVGGSFGYAQLALTGRYFRLVANGSSTNANSAFVATMRGV